MSGAAVDPQGAALDAGNVQGSTAGSGDPAASSPLAVQDPAKAWAELPAAVGAMLSFMAPELRQVYTAEACKAWGEAMVPIAEKYGWSPSNAFPWLSLIGCTAALAVPTFQVLKAKRAAQGEDKPQGQGATVTELKPAAPAGGDPELADPTQKNRPPRPVES